MIHLQFKPLEEGEVYLAMSQRDMYCGIRKAQVLKIKSNIIHSFSIGLDSKSYGQLIKLKCRNTIDDIKARLSEYGIKADFIVGIVDDELRAMIEKFAAYVDKDQMKNKFNDMPVTLLSDIDIINRKGTYIAVDLDSDDMFSENQYLIRVIDDDVSVLVYDTNEGRALKVIVIEGTRAVRHIITALSKHDENINGILSIDDDTIIDELMGVMVAALLEQDWNSIGGTIMRVV